jgi:uncharacterized protein
MKKRLRKKLHMGEFAVFGVSLRASLTLGLTDDGFDAFLDAFLAEAIEANGLWFCGGGSPATGWNGVIDPGKSVRGIPAAALDAVRSWMEKRTEVDSVGISEPWDIWYGRDPFDDGVPVRQLKTS